MKIFSAHVNRQPRTLSRPAWFGVMLFCFLLVSTHTACPTALMSFPEKATASITSIDTTSGLITGKDSATGQMFQFKLTNPILLRSLTVGQAFFVDIGNKLVSFDGTRINGNIVSIGPVDPGGPAGPVDGVKLGPVDGANPAGQVGGAKPGGKGTAFGPIDGATSTPGGGTTNFGPIDGATSKSGGGKNFGPIDGATSTPGGGTTNFGPIDGATSKSGGGKNFGPIDGATSTPGSGTTNFGPIDGATSKSGGGKNFGPIDGATSTPGGGTTNFGPIDGATSGTPNCAITSIDASHGLVTARDNQTGHTFQFRLANASLVQALKPGQAVSANFANRQVSLTVNGQVISGSIVGASQTATQK